MRKVFARLGAALAALLVCALQVRMLTPRPGESVEPEQPGARVSWWPKLPTQTAEQHPIVSSGARLSH